MFSSRGLIILPCLLALLLAAGCRNSSSPEKVKGPGGVTLRRGRMTQQEKEDYQKVMMEQKRRQGVKMPE